MCLTGSGDIFVTSDSSSILMVGRFGATGSVMGEVGGVKKRGVGGVADPAGRVAIGGVASSFGGVVSPVGGVGRVKIGAVGGAGGRFGVLRSKIGAYFGGGMYSLMLGVSGASSQSLLLASSSLSNFACN